MKIKNLGRTIAIGGLAYLLSSSPIDSKPLEAPSSHLSFFPNYKSSIDDYVRDGLEGKKLQFGIVKCMSKIADNISRDNGWFSDESESLSGGYNLYHLTNENYSLMVAVDGGGKVGAVIYKGISNNGRDIASVVDTGVKGFGLRKGIDSFKFISPSGSTNDILNTDEVAANYIWLNLLNNVCASLTNNLSEEVLIENFTRKK